MDMVFNAVETKQMAFVILNDTPKVTKQILSPWLVQPTGAIFRRENDMINDLCVGGHVVRALPGSTPAGSAGFCRPKPQVSTCG